MKRHGVYERQAAIQEEGPAACLLARAIYRLRSGKMDVLNDRVSAHVCACLCPPWPPVFWRESFSWRYCAVHTLEPVHEGQPSRH